MKPCFLCKMPVSHLSRSSELCNFCAKFTETIAVVSLGTLRRQPEAHAGRICLAERVLLVSATLELKSLRPQLYSAADYCEESYFNNEQKQMVLDNLKDYAVRTLVNAIDHLGTVAYKLSDILEQQTLDTSSMELKVTYLNQRLLTCQIYTEKEGLRQQQVLAIIPSHHKHYILPSASAANNLSWHLASETKSTLKGSPRGIISSEDSEVSRKTSKAINYLDAEVNSRKKAAPASTVAMQTLGFNHRESSDISRPSTPYRSFTNTPQREIVRPPVRTKSVLSAFFAKQKTRKAKSSSGM